MLYVNLEGKHNKMYLIEQYYKEDKAIVRINWGTIGRKLSNWRMEKEFNNKFDCMEYVSKKISGKGRKGYRKISISEYREMNKRKVVN